VSRGISHVPSSGSSWPIITFISVDLPAPLRPINPTRLRGGSAALARSRMVRPPRRTVMSLRFSMAGPLAEPIAIVSGRKTAGRKEKAAR